MIQRLRYFLALAKEGSINRTATRLHISQSSLSRQMQLLEQDLDVTLFTRTMQGIQLTPAGHLLHEKLPDGLSQLDEILLKVRDLGRGKRQHLRISYSPFTFQENVTKAVHLLQQEHPEVKLHLMAMPHSDQIAALRMGQHDVGLLFSEATLQRDEFYYLKLAQFESVVALPSTHEMSGRESLTLQDLKGCPFLNYSESWSSCRNEWFVKLCRQAGFNPVIHFHFCRSIDEHLSLLVSENLITLLPAAQYNQASPGITLIPLKEEKATWELVVVWQRDNKSISIKDLVRGLKGLALTQVASCAPVLIGLAQI